MKEPIKIALPKGRILAETAGLLKDAGWGFDAYTADTRLYHLQSATSPDLSAKIFNEKDIPVQVAVGNYDIGICGLDWVEELLARYPGSPVVKIKDLGYGSGDLSIYVARFSAQPIKSTRDLPEKVRIASEYPNLAESFAASRRIKRFSIFSVWGSAEAYAPENAEMVLIPESIKRSNVDKDLVFLDRVLKYSVFVIANRDSWESKDMSSILSTLINRHKYGDTASPEGPMIKEVTQKGKVTWSDKNTISLALPDGHQQEPTKELLKNAGIKIENYSASGGNHRPTSDIEGLSIKVIRPQDMPLQVAAGNFDLAITGRDWLNNHLYQFPSSPVEMVLDLKYGWVRVVSVVSQNWSVNNTTELRRATLERAIPIRIASEYVNIADKYARDNHLGMYRLIPTWGATETFIPDDADVLIENTQTGKTLEKNNLKIIETLFESTACVIGGKNRRYSASKREVIDNILNRLKAAVEETR